MNINILMISIGMVALSSCSTAYKTAQTPDDLYYSAPKEVIAAGNGGEEYLAVNNGKQRYSGDQNQNNSNYDAYDDYGTYRNDRWLRMSIGNPYRLSTFNSYYWNDWGYGGYSSFGSPFGYSGLGVGFGSGFGYYDSWNNPWGGYMSWNSFYNPYAFNYNPYGYGHIGIIPNAKPPIYTTNTARPSTFNPRAYGNNTRSSNVNTSRNYYNPRTGTYSNYNNTNTIGGNNRVNTNTNTRRNTNTYYNNNTNTRQNSEPSYTPSSRPERTYTPSSSGSSGNSGGGGSNGGGGGGGRRPTRGN